MKRVFWLLLTLAAVFAGTRALVRALPGDPIDTLVAETGTSVPTAELRAELRLDRPFWPALASDAQAALKGDFGSSIFSRRPVAPLLGERLVRTLELAAVALALSLPISLLLGLPAAARPGGAADILCSIHGALGAGLPITWLGPILLVALAVWIPLFPLGGSVALPAIALALGFSGLWARLVRERVRFVLLHGAAVGARARGIPEWKVLVKYGLAPGAGALVAYLGTQAGGLMAGAFVVEVIFGWRGMGSLLVDAVLRRDYPVVEAASFAAAAAVLLGSFAGDLAQRWLDPRPEGSA
jgi:peptide/nickel transport system permease protein